MDSNTKQAKFKPDPELKLMDQVRQVLRYFHYAYRTEQTYCDWILRYLKFNGGQIHPKKMGKNEIEKFLTHLAMKRNVSSSTQRQALNAIIFLYRKVLDISIDEEIEPVKSKKQKRPPVVMTQNEVKLVLDQMQGIHLMMARILYGSGLRLMECVRLRVHNFDFEGNKLYVMGKGEKFRISVFPQLIREEIRTHLDKVKNLHETDIADGYGEVYLPNALEKKYPAAAKEYKWQYVFPAKKLSIDPRSDKMRRHHVLESGLQKAVRTAVKQTDIIKRIGCHTFRHSFATHMLENGINIRMVQKLMGHADVKTTEIYTHVMQKNFDSTLSPLDILMKNEME